MPAPRSTSGTRIGAPSFLQPEAEAVGMKFADAVLAVNDRPVDGFFVYYGTLRQARAGDRLRVQVQSPGPGNNPVQRSLHRVCSRIADNSDPAVGFSDYVFSGLRVVVLPVVCIALGFWVAAVRSPIAQPGCCSCCCWVSPLPSSALIEGCSAAIASFNRSSPASRRFRGHSPGAGAPALRHRVPRTSSPRSPIPMAQMDRGRLSRARRHSLGDHASACGCIIWRLARLSHGSRFNSSPASRAISVEPSLSSPSSYAPDRSDGRRWRHRVATHDDGCCCSSWAPVPGVVALLIILVAAGWRQSFRPGPFLPLMTDAAGVSPDHCLRHRRPSGDGRACGHPAGTAIRAGPRRDPCDSDRPSRRRPASSPRLRCFRATPEFLASRSSSPAWWRSPTIGGRFADRLRRWVDRRFFREAYEADAILSDLAIKVRTIVETRPLLETVATRIAESLHVPRIAILLDDGRHISVGLCARVRRDANRVHSGGERNGDSTAQAAACAGALRRRGFVGAVDGGRGARLAGSSFSRSCCCPCRSTRRSSGS